MSTTTLVKYCYHEDHTLPTGNEVFVFGSNLRGRHGAGAAKVAVEKFGAVEGIAEGRMDGCYAIPTKDAHLRTLPRFMILEGVMRFVDYAKRHPRDWFFVTRVGCGLAACKDSEIAPMFNGAPINCSFAEEWFDFLERVRV